MAYKCKVCGYKLQKGEDLCPQCFTARDDGVSGFSGYSKDISAERNSFIEHEKTRESIPTYQELSGSAHRAADEVKKKFESYQNERHKMMGGPASNSTYYPKNSSSFQSRSSYNYGYGANNAQFGNITQSQKKIVKTITIVVVVVFLIPFLVSLITMMAAAVYGSKHKGSGENGVETAASIDLKDLDSIYFPDTDINIPEVFNYDYDNADMTFDSTDKAVGGEEHLKFMDSLVDYEYSGATEDQTEYIDSTLKDTKKIGRAHV